jgi:hypothetical protein
LSQYRWGGVACVQRRQPWSLVTPSNFYQNKSTIALILIKE